MKTWGYEMHCKPNKIMWLFLQHVADLWSFLPEAAGILEVYAHSRQHKDLNRDIF